jgi:hypothetical protein
MAREAASDTPALERDRHQQQRQQAHAAVDLRAQRQPAQRRQAAAQAAVFDAAVAQDQAARVAGLEFAVQRRRLCYLLAGRFGAHRHIAGRLAVLEHRRHVGVHPVIIAVLAAVLDHAAPRPSGADRLPHVGEGLHRHVRMAQDILRRADQLFLGKAAHLHEIRVRVTDIALQIRGRDDGLAVGELVFDIGDRGIQAHTILSLGQHSRKSIAIAEEVVCGGGV